MINFRTDIKIPRVEAKTRKAFEKAKEVGAIQLLTWSNIGSPKESAQPPIKFGTLKGSSSAFVGNKLILIYQENTKPGSSEIPEPAKSYAAKDNVITVVWNTDYAFKMHEERGKTWENLGPVSQQSGDSTDKWLEKHLKADKDILFKLMAKIVREELSK